MSEAGRLGELQVELRDMGIRFDSVLALYEHMSGDPPTAAEVSQLADAAVDPDDPDGSFIVVGSNIADLEEVFRYDGSHPGHCILGPDRTIEWCEHGHGIEDDVKQAVIDAWESDN